MLPAEAERRMGDERREQRAGICGKRRTTWENLLHGIGVRMMVWLKITAR
jgi:hypothetical protein